VTFLGKDVSSWALHQRCRAGLGYLAQQEAVFAGLTVEENLLAVLEQLALSRAERRQRCAALLEDYGLTEVRKNPAGLCSGGQKRRLELARALVTAPKLILLDEPFAGVDPKAINSIRQMIRGIKSRGIAVLITDHNAQQTLNTTDRAYVMSEGLVVKEGSPRELAADPACRQAYFGHDFRLYSPGTLTQGKRPNKQGMNLPTSLKPKALARGDSLRALSFFAVSPRPDEGSRD
jgi:lipopolysaccharide export system ATP-binding protein